MLELQRCDVEQTSTSASPLDRKRRRPPSDPESSSQNLIKPRPLTKNGICRRNDSEPAGEKSVRAKPKVRQYRLLAMHPLPKKCTVEDPPIASNANMHVSLLSVTDVIPLSDLVCDPFLTSNQDYYMAVGDVKLTGMAI